MIDRLTQRYKSKPPRLSCGGSEGTGWSALVFEKYPQEEVDKPLGSGSVVVWRGKVEATQLDLPVEQYCVITVCLDTSSSSTPETVPLHPEMAGHALDAVVYVDMVGCIRAKVIGGVTTHATRARLLEKKTLNVRC